MLRFSILSILCMFIIVFSLPTTSHSQNRFFQFPPHEHGDYIWHTHKTPLDEDISNFPTDPHGHNPDHAGVGKRSEGAHSHTFTHEHGDYPSHTHSATHSHENPGDTHSDPHDVSNDHSRAGKRIVVDVVKNSVTFDPHRHDDYVWHTHSGPITDSTVLGDPHDVDNDHSGVGTTPTNTPPIVGGTPALEESGTPEGTSSPQPVIPVVTERRPEPPPMQPLRVTEYMVRDWSKGGVWIGNSNLPQWIELYNPNAEAVNLKGYTFQYATRQFANYPYTIHTLTLAAPEGASEDALEDGFSIPGDGVAILSTQQLREGKFSGIETTQVYNLNIENVLKRGWVLTDAEGKEVQRIGREAFSALRDPVAPRHQDGARVSYQVYRSESPSESYYYGHSGDIGSPGFYKQPAPAAPSLVRRKRVGTWAALKK